jgi:hypothetical protein
MKRIRLIETDATLKAIQPGLSEPGRGRQGGRCPSNSLQPVGDLIPYSAKELKYLWTLWDEAQRRRPPGLRYRNIYAGAMGVILTGWLIYGMGLSLSAPVGGALALSGALIGGWYSLKSLLHQRQSGPKE